MVGDQTGHGGVVVESSVMTDMHGKRIARVATKRHAPSEATGPLRSSVENQP